MFARPSLPVLPSRGSAPSRLRRSHRHPELFAADRGPRGPTRRDCRAPLGAIPLAFIRNQFDYCSVICPDVVRLAITVPAGAALSAAAFLGTLQTTGSLTRSIGAAAASVIGPANDAFTPIIRNDLNIVLPKAQRGLQVALVQEIRVGSTVVQVSNVLVGPDRTHRNRRRTQSAQRATD